MLKRGWWRVGRCGRVGRERAHWGRRRCVHALAVYAVAFQGSVGLARFVFEPMAVVLVMDVVGAIASARDA